MAEPLPYPADYRARECAAVLAAIRAGESAAVFGLSGAGKSNVLRFLAEAHTTAEHPLVLLDVNRLAAPTGPALFGLALRALGAAEPGADPLAAVEAALSRRLTGARGSLTLLIDRFDALAAADPGVYGQLRALRDAFKYQLTYVIGARRPPEARNELAELLFANTVWLGPLSDGDARWTVARFTQRKGLSWSERTTQTLLTLTRGYPSFLRAACEAHAAGCALNASALAAHPAVGARLEEFWADRPTEAELQQCGLAGLALLGAAQPHPPLPFDTDRLTAKEKQLLDALVARTGEVCGKDDLIRAVWPEDQVFEQGVRDDSLAQLVRRLREKIEPDPAHPRYLHTAPGRGYRLTPAG